MPEACARLRPSDIPSASYTWLAERLPPWLPLPWRPLLVAPVQPAVFALVSLAAGHDPSRNEWIANIAAPLVTCLGWMLLIRARHASAQAVCVVVRSLRHRKQQVWLREAIERMFGRRVQDRFALGFTVLGVGLVAALDAGAPAPFNLFVLLAAIPFMAVSGYGLGLAVTTMGWVLSLRRYGPLALFLIPSQTPALKAASRLTGRFALYFSIELVAEVGVFFAIDWQRAAVGVFARFLVWTFVLFGIMFFLVPQAAIGAVIKRAKHRLERQLCREGARHRLPSLAECESLGLLANLHSRVLESPDYTLDGATIWRFTTSLLLPLAALVLQVLSSPELVQRLTQALHLPLSP